MHDFDFGQNNFQGDVTASLVPMVLLLGSFLPAYFILLLCNLHGSKTSNFVHGFWHRWVEEVIYNGVVMESDPKFSIFFWSRSGSGPLSIGVLSLIFLLLLHSCVSKI